MNSAVEEYLYLRTDFFPHIKHTENNIETKILDEHFKNILRTACIEPDIDELVSKKKSKHSQCSR